MKIVLSRHCWERCQQKGISRDQIQAALADWTIDYPCDRFPHRPGTRLRAGRNGVLVAYAIKGPNLLLVASAMFAQQTTSP